MWEPALAASKESGSAVALVEWTGPESVRAMEQATVVALEATLEQKLARHSAGW